MSPVKEPVCTADYPRTRIDAALIRAEILHPDSFYPQFGTFLDEEDAAMRKRAENVSQYKLPTYQAAAVVVRVVYSDPTRDAEANFLLSTQSSVLAGVESQLLFFFKSSPDSTQQRVLVVLQYLLVLTYIALIFSVTNTINSLILTRHFGNIPMLVARLQKNVAPPTFEFPPDRKRSSDDIGPSWRWRLLEAHCTYGEFQAPAAEPLTFSSPLAGLFTLVISVLCLPMQILLYIWTQEKIAIRAAVSVAGVIAMLPILHFLPIQVPRRGMRAQGKSDLEDLPCYSSWDGSNCSLQPAPIPLPPAIYTVRSAYKTSYY